MVHDLCEIYVKFFAINPEYLPILLALDGGQLVPKIDRPVILNLACGMTAKVEDFVQVRSFLAGNTDVMLENLIARRGASRINSEDLFAVGPGLDQTSIQWKKDYPVLRRFEVLLAEKDSLGLYVSGNPLQEYQALLQWVRDFTARNDVYLVLLEKAKKIFTRSGTMMFALEIFLAQQEVEGVIFPKNAIRLSGKLEEKTLYWVKGNIIDRSRTKAKSDFEKEAGGAGEDSEDEATQEYAELPKLAIEELCRFEEGIVPLFTSEELEVLGERVPVLQQLNWLELKSNPSIDLNTVSGRGPTAHKLSTDATDGQTKVIKVPNTVGPERLVALKQLLQTKPAPGHVPVRLEIQNSAGQWRKVKGHFWLDIDALPANFRVFLS